MKLVSDNGWDEELVPGARPRAYKALARVLVDNGLLAYSRNNVFMFLGASNYWAVLAAPEAQKQLCDITGSDNVSVSYLGASIPYLPYLQKHATRTSALPVSVCIGTKRLSISLKDNGLLLSECKDIASVGDMLDERVSGFCVMPCSFKQYPQTWDTSDTNRLYRYLQALFPDQIELETVMWIIANCVIDPSSFSKFLILYGPGGTGKSQLIGAIEDTLAGCVGTIKSGQLIDTKSDMSIDTAKVLVSNRMVTAGEVNLLSAKLNLHTVKEMTGHDSIVIPPIRVASRCSVVVASNNLPDPKDQPEWTTTAICRRAAVVVMNVKASLLPQRERPDDEEDAISFLLSCIYLYLTKTSMPISTRCLMYSVIGKSYETIESNITICSSPTMQETLDVNEYINSYLELPPNTVGELASLVSISTIVVYGGINFINNIKLTDVVN